MSKTILIVSNSTQSIISRSRFNFLKALKEKGYNVIVATSCDEYAPDSIQILKHYNISFYSLPLDRKSLNPLKELISFSSLFNLYKKIKPNLSIHFTIKPNIYGGLISSLLGIPYICVVTGLGYVFTSSSKFLQTIVKILYKSSLTKAEKIVFQNQDDLNLFLRLNLVEKEKCYLIKGSGVNTDYFSPEYCKGFKNISQKRKVIFLMISRIIWDKGIYELIEASRKLKRKRNDFEIWLLGKIDTGNPKVVPIKKLKKWEEEGIIKYLGESKDVRPYICQSDVVILPSYREGIPRALLEAMAMEKPIITTDAPGCRETVIDGVNGFLVKPKDVMSLMNAMEKMLNLSPEERKCMGKKGREIVLKEFDEKIIIEKYLELIEQVLNRSGK